MTETCLPVVNWLKSWFKPKDEDYFYDMTVSDYNPSVGSTITVNVFVTDGNNNIVRDHSFTLWVNDDTRVTLTTDGEGVASYTYTCSQYGLCRFSIESYSCFINIQKTEGLIQVNQRVWSSSNNLTYTLYVDTAHRNAVLTINGTGISISSGNSNYELLGFVPSDYRPKQSLFCRLNRSNNLLFYLWNSGGVGISNFASSTLSNQAMQGMVSWSY